MTCSSPCSPGCWVYCSPSESHRTFLTGKRSDVNLGPGKGSCDPSGNPTALPAHTSTQLGHRGDAQSEAGLACVLPMRAGDSHIPRFPLSWALPGTEGSTHLAGLCSRTLCRGVSGRATVTGMGFLDSISPQRCPYPVRWSLGDPLHGEPGHCP